MVENNGLGAYGGSARPGHPAQWGVKNSALGGQVRNGGQGAGARRGDQEGGRGAGGQYGGGRQDRDAGDGVPEGDGNHPAGPFLRDFKPVGSYRHTGARSASVLFYRNGGYSVLTVSGSEHHDKPTLGRPRTICEIALGTYVTTLHMELPAMGGAAFFKAEVDIHWTVVDPHLAAVQVVVDVGQRLTAPALERLREVSSQYEVGQAEEADRAITRQCASGRWDDLGADLGLRVRLYVRLRVDDRTIEHMDGIRDAHASAEVTRVHQDRFRAMLQGGQLDQLSYMLAAEPEEAKHFLEKIRQEGRQDDKERIDRLFDMVTSGQIQSTDLETQALNLLNQGRHGVQGPIGSSPAHRDRPQLPPPPAQPPAAVPFLAEPPPAEPPAAEPFTPEWVRNDASGEPGHGPADADGGEPEPPRRRSRHRDDGWAWAEEE